MANEEHGTGATPTCGRRLQVVLTALGLLPAADLLWSWVREPPTRLLDRLLALDTFHAEHVIVPLAVAAVFAGVPLLARWLSRPGEGRRSPAAKIAFTLGVLTGVWMAAEITVRAVEAANGRGGPATYYGPGPDLASFHRWVQEAPVPGRLNVNEAGFRGPEVSTAKPPGAWRLFTLGEASTFLADLPFEETYPALLARDLQPTRAGQRIEVYNAAYRTWTSQHSLIWYLGRVQDFQPDCVTVMHGPLDLVYGYYNAATSRRPFERSYVHNYGPLAPAVKARFVPGARASVLDHSRVFWYLRRMLRFAVYAPAPAGVDDPAAPPRDEPPPGRVPSLDCYRRNLRTLATLLAGRSARLVLITHPHNLVAGADGQAAIQTRFGDLRDFQSNRPISAAQFRDDLAEFNQATRDLAAELHVPLVDLDGRLSGRTGLFADPWTPNALGAQAAAELIREAVQPLVK
jgi:hypothetical protein